MVWSCPIDILHPFSKKYCDISFVRKWIKTFHLCIFRLHLDLLPQLSFPGGRLPFDNILGKTGAHFQRYISKGEPFQPSLNSLTLYCVDPIWIKSTSSLGFQCTIRSHVEAMYNPWGEHRMGWVKTTDRQVPGKAIWIDCIICNYLLTSTSLLHICCAEFSLACNRHNNKVKS